MRDLCDASCSFYMICRLQRNFNSILHWKYQNSIIECIDEIFEYRKFQKSKPFLKTLSNSFKSLQHVNILKHMKIITQLLPELLYTKNYLYVTLFNHLLRNWVIQDLGSCSNLNPLRRSDMFKN